MLLACIKSEQLKLRRSFIWAAFLLLPLIPTVMGAQNYLNNLELLKSEWFSLWTQETLFYSDFFYAPMIAVYCSYLWRLENQNKNRNLLMTAPVPIKDIFFGKLILIGKLTLFTQCWMLFLFLTSGKLVHLTGLPPAQIYIYAARGLLGALVIATLQLLISMVIRSFAVPVGIALLGSITGFLAANSDLGIIYPYSLMVLGMNANKSEDILTGNGLPYLASCLSYFTLFCLAAIYLLKKRDVKT